MRVSSGSSQRWFCLQGLAAIGGDGQVRIANAGHLSPYLNGVEVEIEGSLPLGVFAASRYPDSSLVLKPGDRLTFLSDGVVEAQSPSGELFGFERTRELSTQPARAIADTAQQFGQEDDITVLTVAFTPVSRHSPLREDEEPLKFGPRSGDAAKAGA